MPKTSVPFLLSNLNILFNQGSLPSIWIRQDEMSMKPIRLTSLYSKPHFVQIDQKLYEITGTEVFPILHPCDKVNVKVTETSIKLLSLVVSIIKPSSNQSKQAKST